MVHHLQGLSEPKVIWQALPARLAQHREFLLPPEHMALRVESLTARRAVKGNVVSPSKASFGSSDDSGALPRGISNVPRCRTRSMPLSGGTPSALAASARAISSTVPCTSVPWLTCTHCCGMDQERAGAGGPEAEAQHRHHQRVRGRLAGCLGRRPLHQPHWPPGQVPAKGSPQPVWLTVILQPCKCVASVIPLGGLEAAAGTNVSLSMSWSFPMRVLKTLCDMQ